MPTMAANSVAYNGVQGFQQVGVTRKGDGKGAPEMKGWLGLRDLTTAGRLASRRREAEMLRMWLKREWALNRAYYNGQQLSVVVLEPFDAAGRKPSPR